MKEVKKKFARTLRKTQTPAEKAVWELLRARRFFGLKFRRQHVIEGFVVDFFCPEHNLAIEVDGGVHKKQKDYDEIRQSEIEAKNIVFIRISNEDIQDNMCLLIKKLKEVISSGI